MDIYLSTAYLAPIQYYSKFLIADNIFIEREENYVKQSYRNRCNIVSANGEIPLSIPVVHSSGEKVSTKDIRISEHGNWQHMHWNAIVSAYNSSPFFEYYQDDFYPFYHKKYSFLFDFNEELKELVLSLLNIDLPKMDYTKEYKMNFGAEEIDLREGINPKRSKCIEDLSFVSSPYYQVFASKLGFIGNMSIVDLLFNMGNESQLILKDSARRLPVKLF